MATRQEEKERRRQERIAREAGRNRVLVGLPDRLENATTALRQHEKLIENLRIVLAQRSILKDEVVLDNIAELLGES